MTLLVLHAGATCALAGLCWVVQLVVYPSFLLSGPQPGWAAVHAAHTSAITKVVTLPWAVQGACLAAMLVRHDQDPLLLAATALLALATVVVTVAVSVPLHERLVPWDERAARRLVRTNWWRTAAWTLGAACSLLLLSSG